MTKLIATPIDMNARGSHKQRKELMRAFANFQSLQKTGNVQDAVDAYDKLEKLLPDYLETDDGTDPLSALEEVSANEFDGLVIALLGGQPTVPEVSSVS